MTTSDNIKARERAREVCTWMEVGPDPLFERRKAQGIPTFREAAAKVLAASQYDWRQDDGFAVEPGVVISIGRVGASGEWNTKLFSRLAIADEIQGEFPFAVLFLARRSPQRRCHR
ncbi:MAG: hypothetical protein P8Y48_16625 [Novosphingobium sp.]